MLPIYFPFTVIDDDLMVDLGKFFQTVFVYQVCETSIPERMVEWRDEGKIEIGVPLQKHEREIMSLMKAYRDWAAHHQGGDMSFFKAQKDKTPFFSDTSVFQIRKDIKSLGNAFETPEKEKHPDLHQEIFLQMAQEFDEKNRDIAHELVSQAIREQALMKDLKGEGIPEVMGVGEHGAVPADQPEYMISKRMLAWAHLKLSDTRSSPMLITSSRRAFDELVERVTPTENIVELLTIAEPVGNQDVVAQHRENLTGYIEDLAARPWTGSEEIPDMVWDDIGQASRASLSLNLIPGMTVPGLIDLYVRSATGDTRIEPLEKTEKTNVLLGLLSKTAN